MFCTHVGRAKVKTHHHTIPDMDSSQNGPVEVLFEKLALSGRLSRWLILLAEFDLKYMARKTIKGSAILDFCAENPIKGDGEKEYFPDEDILDIKLGAWKMYFDGAVTNMRME